MMERVRSSETSVFKKTHGVTSQKAVFFIVTFMKTSNLKIMGCFLWFRELAFHFAVSTRGKAYKKKCIDKLG
jgi:hypothetical protein